MQPIHGIVPPLITPLLEQDQLDRVHLERLVEYVLAGGVHGLFVLGTTGEGPSLSERLKAEVVQEACKLVRGRVPVLANISNTSFTESVQLAGVAADAGAAALVTTAPYYFLLEQEDLWQFVRRIVGAVALPVFLYNIPDNAKVSFAHETVKRSLELPRVVGIKDSSGDRSYLHSLLEVASARPGWTVMVGQEDLLVEAVQAGAQGGVLGGANLYPRLLVSIYEAALVKNDQALAPLLERLRWFHHHVLRAANVANGWLLGLKAALALQGLCREIFAEPLHALPERQRLELVKNLVDLRNQSEY